MGDYARARVPILPIVAGATETQRQVLRYAIMLVPVGAAPWFLGYAGVVYGVTASLAGTLMVMFAQRVRKASAGERARRAAQQLFAFSILYLFIVFAALLVESGLGNFAAGAKWGALVR